MSDLVAAAFVALLLFTALAGIGISGAMGWLAWLLWSSLMRRALHD